MKQSQIVSLLILSLIFIAGCNNSGQSRLEGSSGQSTLEGASARSTIEGTYVGQRQTVGPWGTMLTPEHYTFYSDGTAELRIRKSSGAPDYRGECRPSGSNRWLIYWDSGQTPAEVVREGDNLRIDSTVFSRT